MSQAVSDLQTLIRSMQPVLHEGAYCFATLPEGSGLTAAEIHAGIREAEGLSVVVDEETARKYGLQNAFRAAWITLNVHSDLAAVGLTAAFSAALGRAGISCNVVAGHCHDHIFVPYEQAETAMETLLNLQRNGG
ncbi:ACT domain-containing protein [Neisseria sp. CCUG12390]|uniref:ACT domain-containing protein n=1 Tax=Neisseria sp. CCUG12390 TaxID=3392035 RepID=UPI003A0FEC71